MAIELAWGRGDWDAGLAMGEQAITLRVPTERVDDFLKSLTITDERSGKALPVSYPTIQSYDGYVEMTIKLPESRGRLRIPYVTESPAWKPSRHSFSKSLGSSRTGRPHSSS